MANLYPFLFQPNLHSVVWGGNRLKTWKGLGADDEPIGESWEVSAVPSSLSVISNGRFAGRDLASVIADNPSAILGEAVSKRYGGKLPLLVKFIDAERDLSIQVHPDDAMAQREHGKFGKTEMWYVIDAKPNSYLYSGFKKAVSMEEYRKRVEDGTIVDVLARYEVKKGDVFYIPSGRIHAICGGCLVAEVQQSSDVTYRIFDYNRLDANGEKRELHTDLALQALDFKVEEEYRTIYPKSYNKATLVVDSPFFSVRVLDVSETFHRDLLKYDSFIISMCIRGACYIKLRSSGEKVLLKEGHSCLVPARVADYDIIPIDGKVQVLDAFIDNMDRSMVGKINRFLQIRLG
ncbi:MAG: class I mannose-6-phosphate isomerase [Paludibacteraceae bacterium]|nr:class I mannose-6-phosphate isomerase [Paludibacteraceae bacterium]